MCAVLVYCSAQFPLRWQTRWLTGINCVMLGLPAECEGGGTQHDAGTFHRDAAQACMCMHACMKRKACD